MLQAIKTQLRSFKLSGIYNNLEERLSFAQSQSLSHIEFLNVLLEDERNNRRDNSYKKRYAQAKLPAHKTIEDFDFNFQSALDKKEINDYLTCRFIETKQNLVFIGNPGVGKTHLSISIALKALSKNHKVLFTTSAHMLQDLHASKADNSYRKRVEHYLAPELLVIDELGFKKLPNYSADDFFEIISRRYERNSVIITTNKDFDQWADIFADPILASAILDRIIHYSNVVRIKGPSYRQKNLKKEVSNS